MTAKFTAVVEGGLLRPVIPLTLPEGKSVEVLIVESATSTGQDETPAQILAKIAALPCEVSDSQTSLRHDEVLYSREAHP